MEMVRAMSSQVAPPRRSARALSAMARAAAMASAVGSRAPASVTGSTSMTQPWRVSAVVASSSSRASMSASVTVRPSSAARPAWILLSMIRSRATATTCWRCWSMIWYWRSTSVWLSWPALNWVRARRSASVRRQLSMTTRSRSWLREMFSPFTLPTLARFSL